MTPVLNFKSPRTVTSVIVGMVKREIFWQGLDHTFPREVNGE